mmetsp:Transcript_9611/g.20543  ORF Transcript_9611/g.20543 Transcript_9611/m.20543 type:complete len:231 (-) Transcript_9611:164-856(-)
MRRFFSCELQTTVDSSAASARSRSLLTHPTLKSRPKYCSHATESGSQSSLRVESSMRGCPSMPWLKAVTITCTRAGLATTMGDSERNSSSASSCSSRKDTASVSRVMPCVKEMSAAISRFRLSCWSGPKAWAAWTRIRSPTEGGVILCTVISACIRDPAASGDGDKRDSNLRCRSLFKCSSFALMTCLSQSDSSPSNTRRTSREPPGTRTWCVGSTAVNGLRDAGGGNWN